MNIDELPAMFRGIQAKAATSAPDVVWDMAKKYQGFVERELTRRFHPLGSWTNSIRGEPPAWITGELARSVWTTRGVTTGTYATASVAPHTVYARIQELGGTIRARRVRYLHWGTTFVKHVDIPERPYMHPAIRDAISSGQLTQVAMRSFEDHMGF
jgi:phage gpG-like protein